MSSQPYKFQSHHLFPEPTEQQMHINKKRKKTPKDDAVISNRQYEVLAFGYECKLFNDPTIASEIDQENRLIPWKTTKTRVNSDIIWMDRFDVRHWLDIDIFLQDLHNNSDKKAVLDKDLDKERYLDFVDKETDATTVISRNNACMPYNYSDDNKCMMPVEKNHIQKGITNKYKTPSDMNVPSTQQQLAVIEDTANQVNASKDANLLEIKIQVRNSRNPLYSFLNKRDSLYRFYKHIVWISKSGLGNYGSSSEEEEEELQIPIDVLQIIQKTAQYITKSDQGGQLEQHLRLKNDPKFAFLNAHHPYHGYFKSLVTKGIV